MKLREAELKIADELANIYDPSEASQIASLAMEHITLLDRQKMWKEKETVLDASQLEKLERVLARLKNHEPVQYIMNKCWFYGMELFVDKDVLIPRPETEELVEWIVKDVKSSGLDVFEKGNHEADETTQLKILDVGTGSGCIALALKKTMPLAEVWGCDISDRALNIARRNGALLDIRVDFQSVDYLDQAQQRHLPTVDIVVSNPPYVPRADQDTMQPNVLQFEPHTALFVENDDPLVFYKSLIQFGEHRLHEKGRIYMEIHEGLGEAVVNLFESHGYTSTLRKDMQGKDRMVKAEK